MTKRVATWDPNEVPSYELLARGWRWWDEDLLLCPREDFASIADGTPLVGISGRTVVKGRDYIDLDTRYGLIAFGVRREGEGKK